MAVLDAISRLLGGIEREGSLGRREMDLRYEHNLERGSGRAEIVPCNSTWS